MSQQRIIVTDFTYTADVSVKAYVKHIALERFVEGVPLSTTEYH